MSAKRRTLIVAAAVAALLTFLSLVSALVVNAASAASRWPGWIDYLRRYPWPTLLILAGVTVALTVGAVLVGNAGPTPASNQDLEASEARVREHLDTVESRRSDVENRMNRLPPHPRALLTAAGEERSRVWQIVAPFTDEAVVPQDLAREWGASPPAVLESLPAIGRLVVAELLIAYGQLVAGREQLRAAMDWGASPRAFWLVRVARIQMSSDDVHYVDRVLAEAEQIDPSYPLVAAMRSFESEDWERTLRALEGWDPSAFWEREGALSFRCGALLALGRADELINVLDISLPETPTAALLLQLSRFFRLRASKGTGDSRLADATRAVEIAIRARNLRRLWRTDSAEAVATAAEAAVIAEDGPQAWELSMPTPDGQATADEAADPRVLHTAAIGAVLTGRLAQARELHDATPEGSYVRLRIEAELASAGGSDDDGRTAAEAWRAVLGAATSDEKKLHALRALALEGETDNATLDQFRASYPEVVEDIEILSMISSISGDDIDERLRALEGKSPSASVRRAELLRHDDPDTAADILIEASARWGGYPRLLTMAMDCYQDAGRWEQADKIGREVLASVGPQWAGRVTLLRRLVDVQTACGDWQRVEQTARMLLEVDPNDDDARWVLANAQVRGGDPLRAWQTLNRAATQPTARKPIQARLLLDLTRRYANAADTARTALAMLRTFPDDQDVHWAAISSVTVRSDRADVPEDVGSALADAWQSYLDRYPDNTRVARYALRAGNQPPAEIEDHLRRQTVTYDEVLNKIRNENHPIGTLQTVVPKPYSAIFPYRPLGYHPVAFAAPADVATELELARTALSGACLVDASALCTLALLPEAAQTLIALISRPSITDVALRDLLVADDVFGMPREGTLTYDIETGEMVPTRGDTTARERQRRQIQSMLVMGRGLRRIIHPDLLHLPSDRPDHAQAWVLTLDAAIHEDIPLWADDTGLRIVAHSMGIKTFSTQALLTIARERQRIDAAAFVHIDRELIREHVVDFQHDHATLAAVAAEQSWEARSVAIILRRAATWNNMPRTLELFRTAFRNSPSSHLKDWAYSALSGIRDAAQNNDTNTITIFAALILSDTWTRPEQAAAFVAAIHELMVDDADVIVRAALKQVWTSIRQVHATEPAVTVFLHIISQLDEPYRQYGTHLILE